MPSRKIEDCHPVLQRAWKMAEALYKTKHPNNPSVFLTCTHRTEEEQLALYAQGRTKPGKIVTKLKKGSNHNCYPSRAFDVAFMRKDRALIWDAVYFEAFAKCVAEADPRIVWGGNWSKFKDMPHFEFTGEDETEVPV
jgi:peptidoglycan L-alanyl-D-glutamate endopeptidase CwlK